ncbi:hypothetical protein A9Q82_05735 [Cycloclasticus sp. 46_120_T64]|nr:hypothetical protein A9Q82_05735 [Cycloclasticus sp. 46_120_T64]
MALLHLIHGVFLPQTSQPQVKEKQNDWASKILNVFTKAMNIYPVTTNQINERLLNEARY